MAVEVGAVGKSRRPAAPQTAATIARGVFVFVEIK
jgi:hypothetical protein